MKIKQFIMDKQDATPTDIVDSIYPFHTLTDYPTQTHPHPHPHPSPEKAMPKPKPVLNPAPLTNAQIVEKMNISLDTMLAAVMESGLGMETDLEVVAKFTAIIFTSAGVPKDQFMEFMSENWNDEETNAVIQRAAAYHTNH